MLFIFYRLKLKVSKFNLPEDFGKARKGLLFKSIVL